MNELKISKLIWISIKPLIKISVPNLIGAVMVKTKRIDQKDLNGAACIQIFGALPCLVFSNIVPSINSQNSSHIVVCIAFALFYMIMSYILSKVLLCFVTVPAYFRNGFIVAAVWSNWGNIPISVIQSLTAERPFEKPRDADLGVSYASFFVMTNTVLMFAGPGKRMIDQDYIQDKSESPPGEYLPFDSTFIPASPSGAVEASRLDPHEFEDTHIPRDDISVTELEPSSGLLVSRPQGLLSRLLDNLSSINLSLLLGTLIAVTPSLKRLFIMEDDESGKIPVVLPDGKPPLSIILESTEYFGAAAIPLGLLVTGASFASLSIPSSSRSSLPLKAMIGLCVMKLICLPILGFLTVSLVDRFTEAFNSPDGRALKLVCLYYSCTVTSTFQISLSSIAAGIHLKSEDGRVSDRGDVSRNVDLLCSFIAVQYLVYPFVSIIFTSLAFGMVS